MLFRSIRVNKHIVNRFSGRDHRENHILGVYGYVEHERSIVGEHALYTLLEFVSVMNIHALDAISTRNGDEIGIEKRRLGEPLIKPNGGKPEDEEQKPGKKDETKKKSADVPTPSPSFWASLNAATKK